MPTETTALNLCNNQIGQQGLEALTAILPCTNISAINLEGNPANGTGLNQLAELNALKSMCESQRCHAIWPNEKTCIVPKPRKTQASSGKTFIKKFLTSLQDKSYQLIDYALENLCKILGSYAQDVITSCPSYFDPHAAKNVIAKKPIRAYWSAIGFFAEPTALPQPNAPLALNYSNIK